jgi:hypothetical protein
LECRFRFVCRFASLNAARCLIRPTRDCRARRIETTAYVHTDLPYVAVNKDAFPTSPACVAGRIESFRLTKQAQVSNVIFQAQYQAFVRFAVGSSAAHLKPSRSKGPAFRNLSPGGSRFENSSLGPYLSTGPVTLD